MSDEVHYLPEMESSIAACGVDIDTGEIYLNFSRSMEGADCPACKAAITITKQQEEIEKANDFNGVEWARNKQGYYLRRRWEVVPRYQVPKSVIASLPSNDDLLTKGVSDEFR